MWVPPEAMWEVRILDQEPIVVELAEFVVAPIIARIFSA
jgi:hypothetical protein